MKHFILTLALVAAGSAAQANDSIANLNVVTLPAYVVEDTRFDGVSMDLNTFVTANSDRILARAKMTTERTLARLSNRQAGPGRHIARTSGPRRTGV